METRTAEHELPFLTPYLAPGKDLIDCGCGPGSITLGLAEAANSGNVILLPGSPARAIAFVPGLTLDSAPPAVRRVFLTPSTHS
jgi:hypothetical protein